MKNVSKFTDAKDFLGKMVFIKIDRPIASKHPEHNFIYTLNYGFVSDTMSPDGEELDAYVLGIYYPLTEFQGRCIAFIRRKNEDDDKLIIVPDEIDYSNEQIIALTEFQEIRENILIVRQ